VQIHVVLFFSFKCLLCVQINISNTPPVLNDPFFPQCCTMYMSLFRRPPSSSLSSSSSSSSSSVADASSSRAVTPEQLPLDRMMKCNAVRDNVELRKENQQLKEKLNAYAVSSDCGGGGRWWVVAVQILPLNRSFPFLLFLFLFILVLLFRNSFFCSLCIVPCSLCIVHCALFCSLFFLRSSFFLPPSINRSATNKQNGHCPSCNANKKRRNTMPMLCLTTTTKTTILFLKLHWIKDESLPTDPLYQKEPSPSPCSFDWIDPVVGHARVK
jgi:hypothetical protein